MTAAAFAADSVANDQDFASPGNQNTISAGAQTRGIQFSVQGSLRIQYAGTNAHLAAGSTVVLELDAALSSPGVTADDLTFQIPTTWGAGAYADPDIEATVDYTPGALEADGSHTLDVFYKCKSVGCVDTGPANAQTLNTAGAKFFVSYSLSTPTPPANTPPTVEAGGPYSGDEGAPIAISGATASDDDNDSLTYAWSINYNGNIDALGLCSFSDATALNPDVTCTDDSSVGSFTLTLSVDDGVNDPVTDTATATVGNVAPETSNGLLTVNSFTGAASASFDFSDDGTNDTHTALFNWSIDAAARAGSVTETGGAGTASDSRTLSPGCYTLTVTGTATDDDLATSSPAEEIATSQQVDVYSVAFKAPIKDNERNFAKYGNVLPVKVQITSSCSGLPVTSPSLYLSYVTGTGGEIIEGSETLTESVSSADGAGGIMRIADGMYMYNFTTKQLQAGKDYTLRVRLGSTSGPILLQAVLQPKK